VGLISGLLRVEESFDIIERRLHIHEREICFFYIDGFVKDSEMQRVMQTFLSLKELGDATYTERRIPYMEVEKCSDVDKIVRSVLSGQTALFAESFGAEAILIDVRTYPARPTEEPDSDRVMQGAHDGFVETLITNTALIRRRIRDPGLTMRHINLGGASSPDVVVSYIDGIADPCVVETVVKKLNSIRPSSFTLGFQSLAECLIRKGWLNPFPKIRTTERPDTAAAQLMEGSVLVICDTAPQVMILPTSIFHYLQQTDDFYFPPLTGTYLRLVRIAMLLLSVVITPLWFLAVEYGEALPEALAFLVPDEPGGIPIFLQLLLIEIAIDGLKIASMNTPDMLSNSLSIVGALILGDFAVQVGWLSADAIFYMAFVAIANFAQQNHELGYAFKFVRVITLVLVRLFCVWGFILGMAVFVLLVTTNNTVIGRRYLYPLIPFDIKAIARILLRGKKRDISTTKKNEKCKARVENGKEK
jgi:stage V sporulation protein AF